MVREFKLLNEKGQSYSLMDIQNYCLLTEPNGLGYSYSTEYEQLGSTFIENFRRVEQGQIAGTVNFINYDNYKKLIDFIEKSEELKIAYKIPFENSSKEYLKDIEIQSITKTQKQTNGIISESITFNCLSLWYEQNTVTYEIELETNEIRWDFKWDSRFKEYNSKSIEYKNEGHIEAPILLEINGPVINPQIEIYINSELYQKVQFKTEIQSYEKLLYSSRQNDFYINKQKTDGTIESLFNLDVIEFANDNVVRLPKNIACEIRIKAENTIQSAILTILPQYFAV